MAESTSIMQQPTYRCYYDDGTMIMADSCPDFNNNGAGLVTSELTLIHDVNEEIKWPWLLLILGLIVLTSKKGS